MRLRLFVPPPDRLSLQARLNVLSSSPPNMFVTEPDLIDLQPAGDAAAQHWVAEHLMDEGHVDMSLMYFESSARQYFAPSLMALGRLTMDGTVGAQTTPVSWFNDIVAVLLA